MSQASLPVTRLMGKVMLVASPQAAPRPTRILTDMGYRCEAIEDPYAAMMGLCRRPLAYQSLILWLGSLYREELAIIEVVKRRIPGMEIWLGDTDHHAAALAEAMRLGADGLLDEEGLHRILPPPSHAPAGHFFESSSKLPSASPRRSPPEPEPEPESQTPVPVSVAAEDDREPILSAEELRALLRGPG